MKKKHILCLAALCVLSLALPFMLRISADTGFMFTAFDGTVARNDATKTVPEDTMSFTSDGVHYVYYEHFSKLDVISRVYYNTRTHEIVLFNINKSLIFDLANDQTYERPSGTFYEQTAQWKNGNIYLPLDVVASAFGLNTSYINSGYSPAPILRISSQTPSIPDWYYAQQLSAFLYDLYSNSTAPPTATTTGVTPPATTTPVAVTPEPDPPKLIYLAFEGAMSERTANMLDTLSSTNRTAAAAFFVQPDDILRSADLIRRAYAEGHTIGILLTGQWQQGESAVEQLTRANELLKSVIMTKTRLLCIEDGVENMPVDLLEAFISMGFRLWNSNLSPDLSGALAPNEVLAGLRSSLNRTSGTLVVRLDSGETTADILPALLSYIDDGNYSLLTITEWDRPINGADEIR